MMAHRTVAQNKSAGRGVRRGVMWSALNSGFSRLGQFLIGVVIARLISPHEFGIFVVALTVYQIVVNISEIGVSSALIREVDRERFIAPTVTTIALASSLVLAAIMAVAAGPLASALGASQATSVVRVLSLTVVLAGPSAVPSALLTRDYRQDRRFAADMANFVVSNGVLIVWASMGGGVMALAWSRVAGQAVSTIALLLMTKNRYLPGFDRKEARALLKFGIPLAGANLAAFTLYNVDFMVVGHFRGPLALGLYNLAYNISSWPVSVFSTVLASVALPTFARVRDQPARLFKSVCLAMSGITSVALPVSAMTFALAKPLVASVYGARWAGAAEVLQALAVFGVVRVLIVLLSDVIVAVGATRKLLWLQLIWLGALVPVMIELVHARNVFGAGLAHVVVALCVVVPAYIVVLRKIVSFDLRAVVAAIWIPFCSAAAAGVLARIVSSIPSSSWAGLLLGAAVGGVTYLLLAGVWAKGVLRAMRALSRGEPAKILPDQDMLADLDVDHAILEEGIGHTL